MDSEGFGDGWHDCAVTLSGISCSPMRYALSDIFKNYFTVNMLIAGLKSNHVIKLIRHKPPNS